MKPAELKNTSLSNLTSPIMEKIFYYLPSKDRFNLRLTNKKNYSIFELLKTKELLVCVAQNNVEAAKKILQTHPAVLFQKHAIQDYSGRCFENISALQLASWSWNQKMLTMMWPFFMASEKTRKIAQHQLYNLEKTGIHYSYLFMDKTRSETTSHFDTELLSRAYTYFFNIDYSNIEENLKEITVAWGTVVGEAQRLQPICLTFSNSLEWHGPRLGKGYAWISEALIPYRKNSDPKAIIVLSAQNEKNYITSCNNAKSFLQKLNNTLKIPAPEINKTEFHSESPTQVKQTDSSDTTTEQKTNNMNLFFSPLSLIKLPKRPVKLLSPSSANNLTGKETLLLPPLSLNRNNGNSFSENQCALSLFSNQNSSNKKETSLPTLFPANHINIMKKETTSLPLLLLNRNNSNSFDESPRSSSFPLNQNFSNKKETSLPIVLSTKNILKKETTPLPHLLLDHNNNDVFDEKTGRSHVQSPIPSPPPPCLRQKTLLPRQPRASFINPNPTTMPQQQALPKPPSAPKSFRNK